MTTGAGTRPVLFGYDGSDHAKAAIERAGATLRPGPAIVATAWVVVLGSRGRSPVSAALLSSVSSGAVHHGSRPVLVVPRPHR